MADEKDLVLLSDPSNGATAKASSVLQKNTKLYGPMHALDCSNSSTCWNSDGSSSGKTTSVYRLDFGRLVQPCELRLQFQAGFAAEEVTVSCQNNEDNGWNQMLELEAEDDHDWQTFPLLEEKNTSDDPPTTKAIKLVFEECTDFYGRVTIYQLQVWGHEVVAAEPESSKGSTDEL